jgi:alpha-glucuronidase
MEECQGCLQYLDKIAELNEELRSVKRSNILFRKKLRYTSRKLSKIKQEKNQNSQHFRNSRKKDRLQHKRN